MKVILQCMDRLDDRGEAEAYCRRLSPALVTLLSAEPEIQYVALRNIEIVLQRWPQVRARLAPWTASLGLPCQAHLWATDGSHTTAT